MKQITIMVLSKRKIKRNILRVLVSILILYLLISFYFMNHFLFKTEINGVNVSLKAHDAAFEFINSYIDGYELKLMERYGEAEIIKGNEIGMQLNQNKISRIYHLQNPFLWITSLLHGKHYISNDLYQIDASSLEKRINALNCLKGNIISPKNVTFQYNGGSYEVLAEEPGNKIKEDCLVKAIKSYISSGKTTLDLSKTHCYENPRYLLDSAKTPQTKKLLNKYVSTKITYQFGSKTVLIDGNTINKWLSVDENLDVVIDEAAVTAYVKGLSKEYDTVGIVREFQTSTGKKIEISGGLYGWKINREGETEALLNNITQGAVIEREPIYKQRALSREGNEIGDTYVEINITRQHVWFYKEGKLVIQGSVVTGNPNRGNATVLGVYMLNYKQKNATLTGPDYEAKVTYWMPFFGNMGLHDASWRSRFGGEIYKRRGTHGCVNAPLYLAKTIYENIEEGIPIIVYEE